MSDPDLYNWEDPARRFAAQQREAARKSRSSSFGGGTSSSRKASSASSGTGNIDPEISGAAMVVAGTAVAAVVVTVAAVAYGVTKITYEGIRRGLNIKQGLPIDSNQNNVKAVELTGGLFAAIASVAIAVNSYNEKQHQILSAKFPSIAVAFNKGNQSFVSSNVSYETAAKAAISECKRKSANPFSCEVKGKVPAGQPLCIDYGAAVTMQRYMSNNMPNYRIVGAKYFIGFTTDKSQPNTATAACLKELGYKGECTKYYGRTCNFN